MEKNQRIRERAHPGDRLGEGPPHIISALQSANTHWALGYARHHASHQGSSNKSDAISPQTQGSGAGQPSYIFIGADPLPGHPPNVSRMGALNGVPTPFNGSGATAEQLRGERGPSPAQGVSGGSNNVQRFYDMT